MSQAPDDLTRQLVAAELKNLAETRARIAGLLNAQYPVGTRLLVNLRHKQKMPTAVTVYAHRDPKSDHPEYVHARLAPRGFATYGQTRDVHIDDIVGYA